MRNRGSGASSARQKSRRNCLNKKASEVISDRIVGYIPIDPDQFQTKKRSLAKGLRPFFLFGSKDHHFLAITFGRVEVLATAAVFVFGATGTFLFMGMATVFGSVVVTLKA